MDTIDLIRTLSEAFGVSGHEAPVREKIRTLVAPLADEVFADRLGNLFAIRKGRSERTLMVDAHMDEVGLVVTHVDEKGFLRFGLLGGYDERILPGLPVIVAASDGEYRKGVIGTVPPHMLSPTDREKPVRVNDLFIDVGARSADDVSALGIRVGDPAVPAHPFERLSDDVIMGRAFDDRAGCALLVEALKGLRDKDPADTIVFSFTVHEEVGGRGAGPAAYSINPDLAIAVEGTMAGDTPGVPEERQPTRQGSGPAITVADRSVIVNRELIRAIENRARSAGLPYQFKKPLVGGTNAGPIHQVRAGIPTAIISVPCRYIHAPCQLLLMSDYLNTRALLSAMLGETASLFLAAAPERMSTIKESVHE